MVGLLAVTMIAQVARFTVTATQLPLVHRLPKYEFPRLAASLRRTSSPAIDNLSGTQQESFLIPLLNIFNAQYLMRLATGPPSEQDRRTTYPATQTPNSSTLQFFTVVPDTGSDEFW